ncbi:Spo0E family sporulation regulatory protein-aspartic acid phosphatase [Bacillus shivajii]|uniref:Spo0E family sporulation regulatory protein-aspartic acid phosphatase n=1 Tax=Bacillus shivajii TaxID=1983719 RepID=UPI00384C593D
MISTAHTKGFNHPDTIKYSQELDEIIFKYQTHETNRKPTLIKTIKSFFTHNTTTMYLR